jgi:hypothetical protein
MFPQKAGGLFAESVKKAVAQPLPVNAPIAAGN